MSVPDSLARIQGNLNWAAAAVARNGFSWQSAAISIVLLSLLTAFLDPTRKPEDWRSWMVLAIVSGLAAASVYALLSLILRKITLQALRFCFSLIGFFIVGAVRGASIGVGSQILQLSESVDWRFRIVGGGSVGLVLLLLVTLIVSDGLDYRAQLRGLSVERRMLLALSEDSDSDESGSSDQLVTSVNNRIRDALRDLDDISLDSPTAAAQAAGALKSISDRLIRPLSKQVREELDAARELSSRAIPSRTLLSRATHLAPFQPWNLAAIWTIVGISTSSAIGAGQPGFYALALFVSINFILSLLFRRILLPGLRKMGTRARVVITAMSYVTIALASSIASFIPLREFENERFPNLHQILLVVDPILVVLSQVLLAWVVAMRFERKQVVESLGLSNEEVKWLLARKHLLLRSFATRISHQLHSRVQGSLIAMALRISRDAESPETNPSTGGELREKLYKSVFLDNAAQELAPIGESLSNLQDKWKGVLDLEIAISQDTASSLQADLPLRACLIDLIDDAVVNAVKHGGASAAKLSLAVEGDNVLMLEVRDNGKSSTIGKLGEGHRLLSEVAIAHTLRVNGQGAQLEVRLPLDSKFEQHN